ncbi:MAG TPA: cag pathogenicity island protein [Candidatus Blautia faecipullorum]|nr:cag pathogenicity island protein [Candidatus Blautia faecipullorum]
MREKKSRYTEAQNKATQAYLKKNMEQVRFWVKQGEKRHYQEAAAAMGLSMAQFFLNAADEKIEREVVKNE